MQEFTVKKKGIPVAGQLLFLFGWLALIAWISSLGSTDIPDKQSQDMMTPNFLRFAFLFQAVIVFIAPVAFDVFALRRDKLSFFTFGKKIHPFAFLSAIFAMMFILPAVGWLGELNSNLHFPEAFSGLENWMRAKETQTSFATETLLNDKSAAGLIGNLFTMAFMAAFTEEIFFRATLQRTLSDTKINPHLAIWISAFLFSAIHLQFFGFLPRFVLGAILGYLFYYTGNIWISIIAHFLNNALVVILSFVSEKAVKVNPLDKDTKDLDIHFEWPVVALSFMLTIGVFLLLHRMKKNRESNSMTDNGFDELS